MQKKTVIPTRTTRAEVETPPRRTEENGPLVNLFTCPYEDVVFIPEQERKRLIRLAEKEERRAGRLAR